MAIQVQIFFLEVSCSSWLKKCPQSAMYLQGSYKFITNVCSTSAVCMVNSSCMGPYKLISMYAPQTDKELDWSYLLLQVSAPQIGKELHQQPWREFISKEDCVLYLSCPASVLSSIWTVLYLSCPASILTCILTVMYFSVDKSVCSTKWLGVILTLSVNTSVCSTKWLRVILILPVNTSVCSTN